MTLMRAGELLAEVCYCQVYPMDYEVKTILMDFDGEVDLIRTESEYLDNLSEETQQLNIDIADTWEAANDFDKIVVIQKMLDSGIIPKKDR